MVHLYYVSLFNGSIFTFLYLMVYLFYVPLIDGLLILRLFIVWLTFLRFFI